MNNPNFATQKYVTGSDIKRVRKTLRLTQKKFAELVGVSKATMERWETKEDKITGPVVLLLKILEDHPEYVTKIQIRIRNTVCVCGICMNRKYVR